MIVSVVALKSLRTRSIAGKSMFSSFKVYDCSVENRLDFVRFLDVKLSYKVKDGPNVTHQYELNDFAC